MIIPWLYFIKEDEQLLVESFTRRFVVNGPGTFFAPPLCRVERREGMTLGPTEYLRIQDNLTGELRNEFGPKCLFLNAFEVVLKRYKAVTLKKNQFLKIIDQKTGVIRVERGEASIFLEPVEEILQNVTDGYNLDETQYIRIQDAVTGEITNVFGPTLFIPGATETVVERLEIISLKHNQYVKILDQKTGIIRVERGEQSIFLQPNEELLLNVQDGVNVDDHTAVLIRDTGSGHLELVTAPQVFVPSAHQEIIEVRPRILLEDHDTVVIKDRSGRYIYRRGTDEDRSFFLEPYSELLNFRWSTGIHKDRRSLAITHLDSRPKFMWYEIEVRTKDNVELLLGITFFWQIKDVETMVRTTDDVPGDVCSHARSEIIQSVSKVTLEHFLDQFNAIVRGAVTERTDSFYSERGVCIHSVEVRSIACKDAGTQAILQEIIQETTNRLNRLQKQESENEVKLRQLGGDIQAEEMKGKLIDIRAENQQKEATVEGESEAVKVKAFLDGLGRELGMPEKVLIFNTLKKQEALEALAQGSAQLFFTPEDVDLRIQTLPNHAGNNISGL